MKKIRISSYRNEMACKVRYTKGRFIALILFFLLVLSLGSCGGDGGSSINTPPSVTDTSGDFAITVRVDSSNQLYVSWEDPTQQYSQRPESYYSKIYRNGVEMVPSTTASYYTDAGLLPETTYCYRVEVIAVYQYFFPYSYISVGWSSGTACIATLPDTTAPRAIFMQPWNGQTSVPVNTIIAVTFDEQVDPLTVNTTSFLVNGPAGPVSGTVNVISDTATFKPNADLAYLSSYTVTITAGVKDLAGNASQSDYVWTFTTGQ